MDVGGNLRGQNFWKPIIDKIKNRLTKWGGRQLSFVGRV